MEVQIVRHDHAPDHTYDLLDRVFVQQPWLQHTPPYLSIILCRSCHGACSSLREMRLFMPKSMLSLSRSLTLCLSLSRRFSGIHAALTLALKIAFKTMKYWSRAAPACLPENHKNHRFWGKSHPAASSSERATTTAHFEKCLFLLCLQSYWRVSALVWKKCSRLPSKGTPWTGSLNVGKISQ